MANGWLEWMEQLVRDIRANKTEILSFNETKILGPNKTEILRFTNEYADAYEGRESESRPPEGNVAWAYVVYGAALPSGNALPLPEAFIGGSYLVRTETESHARNFTGNGFALTLVSQIGEEQEIRMQDALSASHESLCKISFSPTKSDRTHDGECLIVNAIASRIACGMTVERVFLQSELPPCWSCRRVIVDFMRANERVRMEVRYEMPDASTDEEYRKGLASWVDNGRLAFTCLADVEQRLRT